MVDGRSIWEESQRSYPGRPVVGQLNRQPRPEGRVDTTGVSRGRTSGPDIRPVKDQTSGKAMEVGGL